MATQAKRAIPEGYHTVTPSLTLDNCAQAIEWYKNALGAQEIGRTAGADGKILHADIRIGNSHVMLNDAMMGAKGPLASGSSPVALYVYVEDCDTVFDRAVSAGAKILPGMGKMQDQFWGDRSGSFTDPHGYKWTIATHKEDPTPAEMKQRQDEWMKKNSPEMVHG